MTNPRADEQLVEEWTDALDDVTRAVETRARPCRKRNKRAKKNRKCPKAKARLLRRRSSRVEARARRALLRDGAECGPLSWLEQSDALARDTKERWRWRRRKQRSWDWYVSYNRFDQTIFSEHKTGLFDDGDDDGPLVRRRLLCSRISVDCPVWGFQGGESFTICGFKRRNLMAEGPAAALWRVFPNWKPKPIAPFWVQLRNGMPVAEAIALASDENAEQCLLNGFPHKKKGLLSRLRQFCRLGPHAGWLRCVLFLARKSRKFLHALRYGDFIDGGIFVDCDWEDPQRPLVLKFVGKDGFFAPHVGEPSEWPFSAGFPPRIDIDDCPTESDFDYFEENTNYGPDYHCLADRFLMDEHEWSQQTLRAMQQHSLAAPRWKNRETRIVGMLHCLSRLSVKSGARVLPPLGRGPQGLLWCYNAYVRLFEEWLAIRKQRVTLFLHEILDHEILDVPLQLCHIVAGFCVSQTLDEVVAQCCRRYGLKEMTFAELERRDAQRPFRDPYY